MKFNGLWGLVVAALLGAIAPGAWGMNYGDVTVTAQNPLQGETHHGYVEYRVRVTNHSLTKDHQVTLVMPEQSYGNGHHVSRMSRTVVVGASTSVDVPMYQPPVQMSGWNGLRVYVDGEKKRDNEPLNYVSHATNNYYGGGYQYAILMSRGISTRTRDLFETWSDTLASTGRYYHGEDFHGRSEREIEQWSRNWLSYSRYDALILTAAELRRAPADVRDAIWTYAQLGGVLVTLGDVQPPANIVFDTSQTQARAAVGFGMWWRMGEQTIESWNDENYKHFRDFLVNRKGPWNTGRGVEQANNEFPIVENLGIPARGLLSVVLVFAIIIGPVNLWVLHRMKRRIWMLWTVPAMSAVFSLAVFTYAIFAEGTTAKSRRDTLTLLDQVNHRAHTIGWAGFYAPLTPSDGLHYSIHTELTPQLDGGWGDGGTGKTIDWTNDQHLASGWVSARVPTIFLLRKSEVRRERLEINRDESGGLVVVNGLGAKIKYLQVADAAGEIYAAADIQAGAKVGLTLEDVKAVGVAGILTDVYISHNWIDRFKDMRRARGRAYLQPNTYLAALDDAPFVEPGLEHAKHEAKSLVYGVYREVADAN